MVGNIFSLVYLHYKVNNQYKMSKSPTGSKPGVPLPDPFHEPQPPEIYNQFLTENNPIRTVKDGELFFVMRPVKQVLYAFVIRDGELLTCVNEKVDATVDVNGRKLKPKKGKKNKKSESESESRSPARRRSRSPVRRSYESSESDDSGESDVDQDEAISGKKSVKFVYILDVINHTVIKEQTYTLDTRQLLRDGVNLSTSYPGKGTFWKRMNFLLNVYFIKWLSYRGWEEIQPYIDRFNKKDIDDSEGGEEDLELAEPYDLYVADVFHTEKEENPTLSNAKLMKKIKQRWDKQYRSDPDNIYKQQADDANVEIRKKTKERATRRAEYMAIRRIFNRLDHNIMWDSWIALYELIDMEKDRAEEDSISNKRARTKKTDVILDILKDALRKSSEKSYTPYTVFIYENSTLYPYDLSDPDPDVEIEKPKNTPASEIMASFVDAYTALAEDYEQLYFSVNSKAVLEAKARFESGQVNPIQSVYAKSPTKKPEKGKEKKTTGSTRGRRIVRSRSPSKSPAKARVSSPSRSPAKARVSSPSSSRSPAKARVSSPSSSRSKSPPPKTKSPSSIGSKKSPSKARSTSRKRSPPKRPLKHRKDESESSSSE